MLRHSQKEVAGKLGLIVEGQFAGLDSGRPSASDEGDSAVLELAQERGRGLRRGRDRGPERHYEGDLALFPDATPGQVVAQHQGAFTGRRRTLERCTANPDHRVAGVESGDRPGGRFSPGEGVELGPVLGKAGSCVEIVVGPHRDDQHVRLMGSGRCGDAAGFGIDPGYLLPEEGDSRLDRLAVRHADRFKACTPKHHVELRKTEGESVAPVDDRDLGLLPEFFGKHRAQFETAETCPQNQHFLAHGASITASGDHS